MMKKRGQLILLLLVVAFSNQAVLAAEKEDGTLDYEKALFHDEDDDDEVGAIFEQENNNVEAQETTHETHRNESDTNDDIKHNSTVGHGSNDTLEKAQPNDVLDKGSNTSSTNRTGSIRANETIEKEESAAMEEDPAMEENEIPSSNTTTDDEKDLPDATSPTNTATTAHLEEEVTAALEASSDTTDQGDTGNSTVPSDKSRQEIDESTENHTKVDDSLPPSDMPSPNEAEAGAVNQNMHKMESSDSDVLDLDEVPEEAEVEAASLPQNAETESTKSSMNATRTKSRLLGVLVKSSLKQSPVHADYCSRPPCGFWGDPKRETHFANVTVLDRIISESVAGNSTNGTTFPDEDSSLDEIVAEAAAEVKQAMADELVEGLDDLDKLFEGVTTPDEFDVASNGSTIQEVLMGSATRVLLKRISVGAKIARTKTLNLVRKMAQKLRREDATADNARNESGIQEGGRQRLMFLRNADGKLAPFRSLRSENGDFAPLRNFRNSDGDFALLQNIRNSDGEFAPLQKLRNSDGDLAFPSKARILKVVKAIGRMLLSGIKTVEALVDRLFEGNSTEEEDSNVDEIRQRLQTAGVSS